MGLWWVYKLLSATKLYARVSSHSACASIPRLTSLTQCRSDLILESSFNITAIIIIIRLSFLGAVRAL